MAVFPDPKWLEILKASGGQSVAVAAACAAMLLVLHLGWLPAAPALVTLGLAFGFFLCGFLALVSFLSFSFELLAALVELLRSQRVAKQIEKIESYIPKMTSKERTIIAVLIHRNQRAFTVASDGGYASTLMEQGIVVRRPRRFQAGLHEEVAVMIPDDIWAVLIRHRLHFLLDPRHAQRIDPWIREKETACL